MNTENTVVPAMESSLENPCRALVPYKSVPEENDQSEPSISTIKSIPITDTKSNAIQSLREMASDKERLDKIETITKRIEMISSEQNDRKSTLLEIKKNCERYSYELELNCATPDKREIEFLIDDIESDQEIWMVREESRKVFDQVLDMLLIQVRELSSGDRYVAEAIEKYFALAKQLTDRQMELKSFSEEVMALLLQLKTNCHIIKNSLLCIEESSSIDINNGYSQMEF